MFRAKHPLYNRQRALEKQSRAREVGQIPKQIGEVVEARCGIGMRRAERLHANRQRTLEKRPRARKVSLGLKHEGEFIEGPRRIEEGPNKGPTVEPR
jgi:hypothetical protein